MQIGHSNGAVPHSLAASCCGVVAQLVAQADGGRWRGVLTTWPQRRRWKWQWPPVHGAIGVKVGLGAVAAAGLARGMVVGEEGWYAGLNGSASEASKPGGGGRIRVNEKPWGVMRCPGAGCRGAWGSMCDVV